MISPTRKLPLILRREPFGGIVFDPSEGTLIEFDTEATDILARFFARGCKSANDEEKSFLKSILKRINYDKHRKIACFSLPAGDKQYDFKGFRSPTLVDFQITNKCYMNCSHCYASSSPEGLHASMEDIDLALSEMRKAGVCQVALGGGEPLLHPDIREVLDLCHEKGIVPNLSTGGMHFTKELLSVLRKRCGAVAVSMENTGERFSDWRNIGFERIEHAIRLLLSSSIRTVVQVVVSPANINDLDKIADFCLTRKRLYGVIFLAFKPVGRGVGFCKTLTDLDPAFVSMKLKTAFKRLSPHMRVGYDCCLAPAIASGDRNEGFVDNNHVEGCSALRGSLGLLPNLDVVPCTFLSQRKIGNLRNISLIDIWNNEAADAFRNSVSRRIAGRIGCNHCSIKYSCLGGCPEMDLVRCSGDID
jgi:radical SAM protein with 4Fe4S-binding SPASM domain